MSTNMVGEKMSLITILIADDQRLMSDGLKTILDLEEDMEVIGTVSNGKEAYEFTKEYSPLVVLMDIRMPIMNGVESTKRISNEFPNTNVVMLTTFDEDEFIVESLVNGAKGFLLKDIPGDKLIEAVRDAAKGQMILPGNIAMKLALKISELSKILEIESEINKKIEKDPMNFSTREKEIISLMMQGLNNQQISERIFISEGTVKNYISDIYNKIGINNRSKAIIYFRKLLKDSSEALKNE
ncbi:response regulator transcription factor [Schinkia azotoformans]|uniref:response regulator transcription factor n=2 Tax=Schinkia azotoformans TaxID=1454 RepID=UPI002DB6DAED|nr:response regulator transcription factor [Schinkia azotoformans]MEC1741504.1 response regulator transcription factor [Schinkia azotoformans]MEC1765313.1 response regulator transcription factor [Schinkia azotoformans]MEC1787137.1 response regulator transcription factor [Schinkia azotoformans]MED4374495.1 response regulator transcription factor [Schinkia azotoformans]MED4416565.1 response regulator transcription factor [Schinkia azotoformans]